MSSQRIYCPNCDRKVAAAGINIADMVGVCSGCDHVFSIRDRFGGALNNESEPSRPSGVTIEHGVGNDVLIRRTWFRPMFIFLLFFAIAWDGFLVFWYSMALFEKNAGEFQWVAMLFPICHVAVGIGITYYTIAGFLNRSEISISQHGLQIRHRPIPWRGNRELRRDEIHEIELEFSVAENSNTGLQMVVSAHHVDGRQIVLLNNVPVRQAEYIAWQLASAFKVPLIRNDQADLSARSRTPQWVRRAFGLND